METAKSDFSNCFVLSFTRTQYKLYTYYDSNMSVFNGWFGGK